MLQPPGTGKTHIAKAAAAECNCSILCVSSSSLGSKWHGDSERMLQILFEKARKEKPSIIFIDEIEWLCGARSSGGECSSRMKSELLQQMDGAQYDNEGVLVLAATNKPRSLDEAFRRRFECRVYVPLPEQEGRLEMFQKKLGSCRHNLSAQDLDDLSKRTVGYSGADIALVIRNARMEPIRKVHKANFFKEIRDGYFTPCAENDVDAKRMKSHEIEEAKLVAPPVSMVDINFDFN